MNSRLEKIDTNRAAELTQNLLGEASWTCLPFGAGKFSQVFEVCDQNDNHYVLRIAPSDSVRQLFYEYRMMRQEPSIHQRLLNETNVLVPPILNYDFSRRHIDRDYLVMPKLPGKPLSEANLNAAAQNRALREWGDYVARIHQITDPENRFGYLGEHNCMNPQPTWREAFTIMIEKELEDIVDTGIYDRNEADVIMDLLNDNLSVFESCSVSHLLHGDLWVTNLLVESDGKVTGLLDFDRACWGDIEWDLAIAEYCGITTAPFWEGYGKRFDNRSGEAAIRRFFYLLYEHQKYIVIAVSSRRNSRDQAQRYGAECLRLVERFSETGELVF